MPGDGKGGLPSEEEIVSATPVPITVQYTRRTVMVHTVTSTDLDAVASLTNSVHLTFFGICFGALVGFGVVLTTAKIPDPTIHAAYVALLAVSAIGSAYFGIRGIIDHREARRKLKELKSGKG